MKKLFNLFASAIVILCALTSCGSSKGSNSSSGYGTEMKITECQRLAEQNPKQRVWGMAEHFDIPEAIASAEDDARAKYARALESVILTASKKYSKIWDKIAKANNTNVERAMDAEQLRINYARTMAQQTVSGLEPLKTQTFNPGTGLYTAFVCLEMNGDLTKIADEISSQVKDMLPNEFKEQAENDMRQFESEIINGFNSSSFEPGKDVSQTIN